ncbi:hypothetical protein Tco_1142473 [Tanacetum coccineum]
MSHLQSRHYWLLFTNQHEATQSPQSLPEITPFIARSAKSGQDRNKRMKMPWIRNSDKVKTIRRKHDSDDDEDDDDDEGPSAGSNQGRSTKRRRSDSAASGSAKPPPKDDDQSSKKPRESEASASKQHPTLTSTGWQITDTREAGVDSSMHKIVNTESEQSDISDITFQCRMKGKTHIWEDTETLTSQGVRHYEPFTRNSGPSSSIRLDECHKLLTNKVDLSNPEGHQILRNIYEPLPLGGPPGQTKTSLQTASTWIRNRDKKRVETYSSGLKVIKQRSTLNVLIGMQSTITSKKTIRSSLSPEQLPTETEISRKADEAELSFTI